MKNYILLLLMAIGTVVLVESCKQSSAFSGNNAEEPEVTTLSERPEIMAVLYQQTAAEYRALCHQAFNLARMQLDLMAPRNRSGKKMSVIVDVDETMLDNSPYEAKSILEDLWYPDGWDQWMKSSSAQAVPGALDFARYAQTKNIEVFYITNRSEKYSKETLLNLQKLGFPFADSEHLLMKQDESSKKARREHAARSTEVLLLIGDNLADFSEMFEKGSVEQRNEMVNREKAKFGSKFILLPNAIYGDWVGALYEHNNALTPEQKSTMRKEALKPF